MSDPYLMTVLVGGGLLVCGYMLGRNSGRKLGFDEVMAEMFKSGLVTPEQVLTHYANEGNERARNSLAVLHQYKREQANKEKNDV